MGVEMSSILTAAALLANATFQQPAPLVADLAKHDPDYCVAAAQQGAGFKGNTISLPRVLGFILVHQHDFEKEDFSFLMAGAGKGGSLSATILTLMEAYYSRNYWVSPLGVTYASVLPSKLKGSSRELAADIYGELRNYLIFDVFNGSHMRFAVDPNGSVMTAKDWDEVVWHDYPESGTPKANDRADWLLWHLANGENYQIGCRNARDEEKFRANLPPPPKDDPLAGMQELALYPVKDATPSDAAPDDRRVSVNGRPPKDNENVYTNWPWSKGAWSASGERDDLALSAFGLADPLVTSPSFSVQPGTSTVGKSTVNTYAFTAQGTLGYTLLQRDCTYNSYPFEYCTTPYQLNLFGDVFYGQDKNAPKVPGASAPVINRFGLGGNFAARVDPSFGDKGDTLDPDQVSHRLAILVQAIPEFVTDSQFESKTFYFEVRGDLLGMPVISCFGNSNVPFPQLGFKFHCGFAAITDYAHNFKTGEQPSLYNNFFRVGGEVGGAIAADAGFCENAFCDMVTSRLSLSAWYKLLADTSASHASVHNFTAQLSYNVIGDADSGKGVALTAKYTDGVEDITLYKLPTWSIGIKAGL